MNEVRVVYDCNIYWKALFYPTGLGNACLTLAKERKVLSFVSWEVKDEIADVIFRPEFRAKFPKITDVEARNFVDNIAKYSILVTSVPRVFQFPRDPRDEPYVDLAKAADADYIVTTDNDLLDLMTGGDLESKQFRQRFRGLKIVTPIQFLETFRRDELALKP